VRLVTVMELLVPIQEGNSVSDHQVLIKEFVNCKTYGMQLSQPIIRNQFKNFLESPKKTAKILFF